MKKLSVLVSEDKKRLTVKSDAGDAISLTTEELNDLIPLLLSCRVAMDPPLPYRDMQPGDRFLSAEGMRWWTGLMGGQSLLALHHPGLGWIATPMLPEGLESLRDLIEIQLPLLDGFQKPTVQ